MFEKLKIKQSLIIGFGTTIAISLCIIIASLIMMSSQRTQYHHLIEKEVEANEQILYARLNANIAARNVRDILLIPDDPNNSSLEKDALEAIREMNNNLTLLESSWPDGVSKTVLNKYTAAAYEWEAIASEILELYNSNKINSAVNKVMKECTPALNEMSSYAKEVDNLLVESMDNAIAGIELSITIAMVIMIVVIVLATIFVVGFAVALIKCITEPTEQVRNALVGFSQGNLEMPVTYKGTNELGEMCQALRTSQDILGDVISDVGYLLGEMANGNFNVRTRAEDKYVGALTNMLQSVRGINIQLSDTLSQITLSAEQVAAGSDQVASGAQLLAQGATEQASSVEELSATISEISAQVNNTATNSTSAMKEVKSTGDKVETCNGQMEQMTAAMEEIAEKSNQINKIIKTIEDIAFQTNILALNAAVEAARAGEAGKGFAVVADEVRSLAAKSAEASKNTSGLLGDTVEAVNRGTKVVNETAATLKLVVEGTQKVSKLVLDITEDAQHEAASLGQVTQGIDQISSVIQTTSATSEQSAAASEELSSQANLIKQMMNNFKLRTDNTNNTYYSPEYVDSSYDTVLPESSNSKY